MAVVGVIPAAGHATRLQPLDGSKEMLSVGGRAVIDYITERMRAAPCDQIRIVTRPEKADVVQHGAELDALVVPARPPSLGRSLLAGLAGLSDDDVVLIGFPDSIWEPVDGYARVLPLLGEGFDVGLGLFRVDADMRRFEPVLTNGGARVEAIEFKPEHPSSNWLWGCAALPAGVLRGLGDGDEPGVYFNSLCRSERVGAVRLSHSYIDIGTPAALAGVA